MNRVMVMGCSGSGKSTLSQKLHHILKLPVIHLDKYYWQPNWIPTPNADFDRQVEHFARTDQWIMDGNYSRTIDIRMNRADLIVYLDMPRWLCLYRVLKRRVTYRGQTRPDMNEGCQEKIDAAFLKWIWTYRKRSREKIMAKLQQVRNRQDVVIITSGKQLDELIGRLENACQTTADEGHGGQGHTRV